ncbi:MAG: hypothetical protein WCG98_07725 [bacterium]
MYGFAIMGKKYIFLVGYFFYLEDDTYMKYWQALQRIQNSCSCPFCTLTPPVIIEETSTMIVTPSRAPYNPYHIMIVSKRHVALLSELTQKESKELFVLIGKWNGLLHTSHKNVLTYLKD